MEEIEGGRPTGRLPGNRAGRKTRGWHRWLGLLAAGPVILIAATGVLLNHGPGLGLDQRMVQAGWLAWWYGLSPREPFRAFRLDPEANPPGAWLVETGGQAFYRGKSVGNPGPVLAAGRLSSEILVVGEQALLLLDAEGGLIEELHPSLLPTGRMLRGGERQGAFVCETAEGTFQLPNWSRAEATGSAGVRWFQPASEPPPEVKAEVERAYRGEGLPLSRVVLDVHSGRIFGAFGVVCYDLAAFAFLALVGTGLYLGLTKRR